MAERRRFRVQGVVQGVGFRLFVYGLAQREGLAGFVMNEGDNVLVEAEGEPEALDRLAVALRAEQPALARVDAVRAEPTAVRGDAEFRIERSVPRGPRP